MVIVSLAHHIDLVWMYEAYRQTRKDGAAGMDEVTAAEYAEDLDANLRSPVTARPSGHSATSWVGSGATGCGVGRSDGA